MEIKIIKHTYTNYDEYKKDGDKCSNIIRYAIKYRKCFLGIKYWKYFKELNCGIMGNCYYSIIWMDNEYELIHRFNCEMTKDIFEINKINLEN